MLETPSTQLQHPEHTNHTTQNQGTEPVNPITCIICQASYTPSNLYQHFLQVSPIVLESAYMSMCHYCFRCRRPACPECWDPIHRICAACVQDANLPFRTQVEPLDGILLLPISPISPSETTHDNTASSLFICIKHGKFHTLTPPSTAIAHAETTPPQSTVKPSKPLPNTTQEPPPSSQAQPSSDIAEASLVPALEASSPPTLEPAHVLESPAIEVPEADPSVDTFPIDTAPTKPHKSAIKKLELILTAILLLALLAIAIIIALAEYSIKA